MNLTCPRSIVTLACFTALLGTAWAADAPKATSSSDFTTAVVGRGGRPFRITVVDKDTGRGVPGVQLRTTNFAEYWTDSAGVVAFYEPDLMNQKVFFYVGSHGYTFPMDGWMGFEGTILDVVPGGSAVIKIRRENIAQRIYRMTGAGIYRDSILLGDEVPPVEEAGKPPVMGQDGGDSVVYKGKMWFFWGDTAIPRFPLGVFRGTFATCELPGKGGLDPDVGIQLVYKRNNSGEPRPMMDFPGGVYWYAALRTVLDKNGNEHMISDYAKIEQPIRAVEFGLVEYSEKTGQFELVHKYPGKTVIPFEGQMGPPFRVSENGKVYLYYLMPYPVVRGAVDYESLVSETDTREAFTCLKDGSRFDGSGGQLDRDADGRLRWAWKRSTSPIAEAEMTKLVKAGAMKDSERWYAPRDIETGKTVLSHHGSTYWNPYRKRYTQIRLEHFGETLIGEVWYLEGDTPTGPWVYAQKVITHAWEDHACSFYCAAQIPQFDKDDGRTIYLKGSMSAEFGDIKNPAPRHNYNNIMYKMDLDDPRLYLPVPVYRIAGKPDRYGTNEAFEDSEKGREIVCFAPDRPRKDTVGVYQVRDEAKGSVRLTTQAPAAGEAKPVFYAVPADADKLSTSSRTQTVPFHEYVNTNTGQRIYTTKDAAVRDGFERSAAPVCRVWPNPIGYNPYE